MPNICGKDDLYMYLALNDTIHDFGKGADRGQDINEIVKDILNEPDFNKFTPFGTDKIFSTGAFELNAESYLLNKYNLIGIPTEVLKGEPFKKDVFGKSSCKIFMFENQNGFKNFALQINFVDILKLTDAQKDSIYYTPNEIEPSIDNLSTLLILDPNKEIKKDNKALPDKNKIGQFIMKFYFYGNGKKQTLIHNADAGAGNLKCAFAQGFDDNVLGVIKDTTNYADSAVTSTKDETQQKKCFPDAPPNPFEKDIGAGADIENTPTGLVLKKKDDKGNILELPSIFPSMRSVDSTDPNNNIYIFSNNLFTCKDFVLGFRTKKDNPWIPYKAPFNFELFLYVNTNPTKDGSIDQLRKQILIGEAGDPAATASFYPPDGETRKTYSLNGPSVDYLKKLIAGVNAATDEDSLTAAFKAIPSSKSLNLQSFLESLNSNLTGNMNVKKNKIIKLLMDLKRCGDYEQVDSIKLIQEQNLGVKNVAGLQDILFTSVDRLCTLYSRYKNNNCMWVKATENTYVMYRQPYIYPSKEILEQQEKDRLIVQYRNKTTTVISFLKLLKTLNDDYLSSAGAADVRDRILEMFPPPAQRSNINESIQNLYNLIVTYQLNMFFNTKFIGDNFKNIDTLIEWFTRWNNELTSSPFFQVPGINPTVVMENYVLKINGEQINYPIDWYFNILNQNLFGYFEIKDTTEKVTDPINGNIVKVTLSILDKKNKTVLNFLEGLSEEGVDKSTFIKNYYRVLKENIATPTPDKRSGRPAATVENDYLFFKGIFNMIEQLFEKKVPELTQEIDKIISVARDKRIESQISGNTSQMQLDTTSASSDQVREEFDSIFNDIKENIPTETVADMPQPISNQNTFKLNIDLKKLKEVKQKKKQVDKDEKAAAKRVRNLEKIKALQGTEKNKRQKKGSLIEGLKRKSYRIAVNSPRTSPRLSLQSGGLNIIQKGGAGLLDNTLGIILIEVLYDLPDIMNQIYSSLLPNELLQLLLLNFDINYTGFSKYNSDQPIDTTTTTAKPSQVELDTSVDENIKNVDPIVPSEGLQGYLSNRDNDILPLSRREYLLNFVTDLQDYLQLNGNEILNCIFSEQSAVAATTVMNKLNTLKTNLIGNTMTAVEEFLFSDEFISADGNGSGIFEKLFKMNNKYVVKNMELGYFLKRIVDNSTQTNAIHIELEKIGIEILQRIFGNYYLDDGAADDSFIINLLDVRKFVIDPDNFLTDADISNPNKVIMKNFGLLMYYLFVKAAPVDADAAPVDADAATLMIPQNSFPEFKYRNPLKEEQKAEITAEIEKMKAEGRVREEIERALKAKYADILAERSANILAERSAKILAAGEAVDNSIIFGDDTTLDLTKFLAYLAEVPDTSKGRIARGTNVIELKNDHNFSVQKIKIFYMLCLILNLISDKKEVYFPSFNEEKEKNLKVNLGIAKEKDVKYEVTFDNVNKFLLSAIYYSHENITLKHIDPCKFEGSETIRDLGDALAKEVAIAKKKAEEEAALAKKKAEKEVERKNKGFFGSFMGGRKQTKRKKKHSKNRSLRFK